MCRPSDFWGSHEVGELVAPSRIFDELAEAGALASRRQLSALMAILGLPGAWRGQPPDAIAASLVETVVTLARLDVAYYRVLSGDDVSDHAFPRELCWSRIRDALAADAIGATPCCELPEPNSLGRTHARLVVVTAVGGREQLIAGSWRENFPTAHEQLLLQTAANQAALAIQSSREARHFHHLLEERERLQRVNLVLMRLGAVAEGLSRATTSLQVARVLLSEGLDAIGASAGSVHLLDEAAAELHLIRSTGHPSSVARRYERLPLDRPGPLTASVRERRPIHLFSAESFGAFPEAHAACVEAEIQGLVIVPLTVDDRCLGALCFTFRESRQLAIDEQSLLQGLTQQAAQAFDRARLLEAERHARAEAEANRDRLSFLAETSALVASSLDAAALLTSLTQLAVPRLADACEFVLEAPLLSCLEPRRFSHLLAPGGIRQPGEWLELPVEARGARLATLRLGTFGRGFDAELAREFTCRIGPALDNGRLYAEALQADRRKDEFLAMLGHELRNPLSPMVTALHLMKLKEGADVEKERGVVERHARHLTRLVDDLLDVSRITSGKIQLRREIVDLDSVVQRALEMVDCLFDDKAQNLQVRSSPSALRVDADPGRLAQVIANLLSNAAKYTPRGGSIELSLERRGARALIRVRDDGQGIDPTLLPHVFEKFVQERRAAGGSSEGLGLGLTIVQNLVQLHGGTVQAHSEGLGRGSEFVVTLPLAAASVQPEPDTRRSERSAGNAVRVLIVDDNTDAAELLAELLEHVGYRTAVAADGPSGLSLASEYKPEIALMDIGLPIMDGYELARRFRAEASLSATLLVAVTGFGASSDRARAKAAGFDAHMTKPVDATELLSVLDRLMRANVAVSVT